MSSIFWPKRDVEEIRVNAAQQQIDERLAQFERDQKEREALTAKPVMPSQPAANSWDFSSLRGALMPWDQSQQQPQATQMPAQQPPQGQPDAWDFSSLKASLMPWQPQQVPQPEQSMNGTPVAAPASSSSVAGADSGSASWGAPSGPPSEGVQRWSSIVDEAVRQYGVPREIIMGIMDIESGGNPDAVSAAGAMGLMQVMPFHYGQGENGMDPRTSILRGAKILADNYRRWGDWDRAAAAYFGAIDENGRITDATDATGTTGSNYVRLFRGATSKYTSRAVPLPDVPNQNTGLPAPVTMPDVPNQNPGLPPPVPMPEPSARPQPAAGSAPAEPMPQDGRDWVYVNTEPMYPAHRGWRLRHNAARDGQPVIYDPRQSNMNTAGAVSPAAPVPAAGPGVTSTSGPAVPPHIAQRWQQRVGSDMTPEDVQQLRMLGVM